MTKFLWHSSMHLHQQAYIFRYVDEKSVSLSELVLVNETELNELNEFNLLISRFTRSPFHLEFIIIIKFIILRVNVDLLPSLPVARNKWRVSFFSGIGDGVSATTHSLLT